MIELLMIGAFWFINLVCLTIGIIVWPELKIRALRPLLVCSFVLGLGSYFAVPLLSNLSLQALPLTLWFYTFGLAVITLGALSQLSSRVELPKKRGRYPIFFLIAFLNWLSAMLANLSIFF